MSDERIQSEEIGRALALLREELAAVAKCDFFDVSPGIERAIQIIETGTRE